MLPHKDRPDVLHIVQHEKFVPALIGLISRHLQPQRHHFFFVDGGDVNMPDGSVKITQASDFRNRIAFYWKLLMSVNQVEKIVLHGLFSSRLILILWLQPWLWKRCYWVIWGGDLYTYEDKRRGWRWRIKEFFRRPVIRNLGNLVTYIPGDVELARKWYGCKGEYRECLMYPSNTVVQYEARSDGHTALTIQIGNSADPANCHDEMLDVLDGFNIKKMNIFVVAPLSYGDSAYADYVARRGHEVLGDNFRAMREFLSMEDYLRYLREIDVGIFAHRRQQAMGNMIALLGFGKKVILRSETTSSMLFKSLGFAVYPLESFDLTPLAPELAEKNRRLAAQKFSEAILIRQWRMILEAP